MAVGIGRVPQGPDQYRGNATGSLVAPYQEDLSFANDLVSGLNSLTSQLKQRAQQHDEAVDGLRANDAYQTYTTNVAQRMAGLDPLADDYIDQVKQIQDEERATAQQTNIKTAQQKVAFQRQLIAQGGADLRQAFGQRQNAIEAKATADWDAGVDAAKSAIFANPEQFDTIVDQFGTQASRLLPGIPPAQRLARQNAFADEMSIARISGYIEKGQLDTAKSLLSGDNGLDPRVTLSLEGSIRGKEAQMRADYERAQSNNYDRLMAQAADGQLTPDQVKAAYQSGRIKGSQYASLTGTLQNRMAREEAANQQQQAGVELYDRGNITSQKEADVAFAAKTVTALKDVPEDQRPQAQAQLLQDMVRNTGWVPSQFKDSVVGAETSGNPDRWAAVAKLNYDLTQLNPNARTGAGDNIKAVQQLAIDLSPNGVPTEETFKAAATQIRDNMPTAEQRQKNDDIIRTAVSKAQTDKTFDPAALASDAIGAPATPYQADQFKTRVQTLMATRGIDITLATKLAQNDFKSNVGVSALARSIVPMDYPPEKFIDPRIDGVLSYANSVVRRDLSERHGSTGNDPGSRYQLDMPAIVNTEVQTKLSALNINPFGGAEVDADGMPPWRLVPDNQTAAQIQRGERPSYVVQVRAGPGGTYYPAPSGQNSSIPLRYTPPTLDEVNNLPEVKRAHELGKKQLDADNRREKEFQGSAADLRKQMPGLGTGITDTIRDTVSPLLPGSVPRPAPSADPTSTVQPTGSPEAATDVQRVNSAFDLRR